MNILIRSSRGWIQGYAYSFTAASHALQCDFVNAEQVRVFFFFGSTAVDYNIFFFLDSLVKNNCEDNSYNTFIFFPLTSPPSSAVPKK